MKQRGKFLSNPSKQNIVISLFLISVSHSMRTEGSVDFRTNLNVATKLSLTTKNSLIQMFLVSPWYQLEF